VKVHFRFKRDPSPRGFLTMNSDFATINGFESMCMIRRGHCILRQPGMTAEVRFDDKLFGVAA
jgi:IS6 family transposase